MLQAFPVIFALPFLLTIVFMLTDVYTDTTIVFMEEINTMVALLTIPAGLSLSAAAFNENSDTIAVGDGTLAKVLLALSFPNAVFHTWALYRYSGDAIRKVDNSIWLTNYGEEKWWKITPGETLCPPFFYGNWCTYCEDDDTCLDNIDGWGPVPNDY